MSRRSLVDPKIKARRLFVEDGVTSPQEIAELVGCTRQTVAKWIKADGWASQRGDALVSAPELAKRMIRVLTELVTEIEQKQKDGHGVSPDLAKRMLIYSRAVRNLSEEYDERGVMIAFSKKLVNYLSSLPHERELLKGLQRVMPGFFAYMDN